MLKVFLVEDETVIREGLRDNIPWEQYGYQLIGEAADGEIALPLIRKLRPDVLITDIKMPFMDGLTLSKIVSAEFPKMKIIIISGYDDFEYARQAIEVGVGQYLLKPITKQIMRKTLLDLKEKIEQDMEKNDYQIQFQNEMHEYEQFSRRHFFEKLLEGELSVKDIYDEAAKLSIEITASCYNLMFIYLQEKGADLSKDKMESFFRRQDEIHHYFLRNPQYILFSWNVNCYGVLIKSEQSQMAELMDQCLNKIKQICMNEEEYMEWYVAMGESVERLSMLPECYQTVNHYFAYRFIVPNLHILNRNTLSNYLSAHEERDIEKVDSSKMNQDIIREFLTRGNSGEVHDFVESYLQSIKEAMKSRMFRDYIVLNIRFATIAYLESIGATELDFVNNQDMNMNMKSSDVFDYFVNMLESAIHIRDKEIDYQSGKILRRALEYIDENYDKETISLNSVAGQVKVSANYFSAIFSQGMQKTFIEYVTGKRMEKAKKLLRSTNHSSNQIATMVGYKDPHYFSFVFKKTQGCSPREYRTGKKS